MGVLRRFIADYCYQKILRLPDGAMPAWKISAVFPCRACSPFMSSRAVPGGGDHRLDPLRIYAREFGDGGLDFGAGRFFFNIRQSYLIEKGRLTAPDRQSDRQRPIREILNDIGMVGNDFKYDRGVSYCQKNGQILPVRVGQPTIKINKLYVNGGQSA